MQALKYLGLTLLLIGCNSINNKDTIESTKENSVTISVGSTINQSLKDKAIDTFKIDSFLVTESSV